MTRTITAHKRGTQTEFFASIWLTIRGYKILEKRYNSAYGEIDILAQKGKTLIAVEVKYRAENNTAFEAISSKQVSRISNSLLSFQASHTRYMSFNLRVDALVYSKTSYWKRFIPTHLKNIGI
ncbi:MAG: YraN family protein [Alphaproteobacteria bacterium]|nr:YraN family protein [Alphaproteobacteria bacterium]